MIGAACLASLLSAGCDKPAAGTHAKRVELRKVSGSRVELVPTAGQNPWCLVYTRSSTGVLRQLTMAEDNTSIRCPAGEPVGGVSYRIPVDEGEITALVFFSTEKLNAGSVGQQLFEMPKDQPFSPINLRLPGQVVVDTTTFKPEPDAEPAMGGVVGAQGTTQPPTEPAAVVPPEAVLDAGAAIVKDATP